MAEVTSVGGNGLVHGEIKDKSIVTGAGMFQGRIDAKHGQVWYPAKIRKTFQMSNPDGNSVHRIIDVPVTGPDGGPVWVDDPAALAAVKEHWKGQEVQHDWIPVAKFNEAKEPIREAVMEMKEIMAEQAKAQAAANAATAQAIRDMGIAISAAFSGKAPTAVTAPDTAAPKRRGRPPKPKEA